MPESAVADAGGLLVLAGLLQGHVHDIGEILSLDATSLLVAEYLALRHEGAPERARRDFGLVGRAVAEWFPVRALSMDAVLAGGEGLEIDSAAALALAESLQLPLATKNGYVTSERIPVLRC